MPNPTILYNNIFNDLHALLTKLLEVNEKTDFSLCLGEIRERAEHSVFFDRINDGYMVDLKTLNAIRNILIHKNNWIEIPTETIEKIRSILIGIEELEKSFHTRAIEIFGKKIFIANDTDTIQSVIEAMGVRNFSHVPVYTQTGRFRGVFSLKSVILWISRSTNIEKDTRIQDISIDTKNLEYLFLPSDIRVSEIEGYFREYSKNRKKLGAIFLTPSGTPNDPIEGIITAWDLPMIYERTSRGVT